MLLRTRPASAVVPGAAWLRAAAGRIVWSGFLAAVLLEGLAILVADPLEVRWGAQAMGWPAIALWAAAFLLLWILASALSLFGFVAWLVVGAWKVRSRLR